MTLIAETATRVEQNTPDDIDREIEFDTRRQIADAVAAGPAATDRRLAELDREWDIERTLEASAATLALAGVVLGFARSRRWFLLPGVVAGFLLQHAVQGGCPPVSVFRRLGIRTAREIELERQSLKAVRGDFRDLPTVISADDQAGMNEIFAAMRK
jgi:hypothetical protein